jgi:Fe-S cluster biogenesis protein NfuA
VSPAGPKRPVIIVEHTPNPDSVKLVVHHPVAPQGSRDFDHPAEASAASPVAARLFRIEGVRRVYVDSGFVTVTKDREASWEDLGQPLIRALQEHVLAGEPWLRPGFAAERVPLTGSGSEHGVESRIRAWLEREIRPVVRLDGGDVALESFKDGVVRLDLRGACAGCPRSLETLKDRIEVQLRRAVPEVQSVVSTPS